MKKKKKGISKKTVLIILFVITTIVVSYSVSFLLKSSSLAKYKTDKISFLYDRSWSVSKLEDNIYLTKNNGSSITISVRSLDDETENMTVEEINSSVISKLMSENEEYKKISDKAMKLTSVYYDGYKTLLENNTSEALVFVVATNDNVLVVNYTAKNKYFDMSLDSVESIVGSILM